MRWSRWRTFLPGVSRSADHAHENPDSPAVKTASPRSDFQNILIRVAQARGVNAAEQLISIRTGQLWARLSMVAEPKDSRLAEDYALRYLASVTDWIAWLQRPTDTAVSDATLDTSSTDAELAALLDSLPMENRATPPFPNFPDRVMPTLEWRATTAGFPAAEDLIIAEQARSWSTLSHFCQRKDPDQSLAYLRRAYELNPLPTTARRLQQILFIRGNIVEAEHLFRISLVESERELTEYEATRLARLQSWRNLFVDGFPMPPQLRGPDSEADPRKVVYYLAHSLPLSGAGYDTRSHGLLTGLQSTGYEVAACTRHGYPWDTVRTKDGVNLPEYPVQATVDSITYHRLYTQTEGRSQLALDRYLDACTGAFESFAREQRASVIHAASNFEIGLPAVAAARRLGLPSIYEVRGLWEVTRASKYPLVEGSELYAAQVRLETEAAITADRVITITSALKDELVRRGVPAERISVVPNSVDPGRFLVTPRDRELEQQLGLEGKRIVGYVGSFTHYEGLDHLLYALSSAIDQGLENLHLLLVGGGASGRQISSLVAELELDAYVTMTGRVPFDQVHRYYSLIDIAPFPRKPLPVTEMVSPLKPLEAMAMEKAVIVSSVAAMAEMVEDGTTGLVFDKGNIDSLTAALVQLANDPGLCDRLGTNAREWILQNRTWDGAAAAVAGIYQELIEMEHRKRPLAEARATTV